MIQRPLRFAAIALFACVAFDAQMGWGQQILTADGVTDAYTRIKSVLGASPETPDCSHPAFGPHITQAVDDDLKKYVFVFNIHVTPDNDRCSAFDRQRLEIKTDGGSPDYVKGFLNDSVTFRWKFKLPAGFQPSTSFTHIHQIKAYDGDAGAPIITLTPRKADPNRIELIHIDSHGVTTKLANTPLEPFLGRWVEAYEKITYGHDGLYSIAITSLDDSTILFTYSNDDLDLWRTGTTIVRPKWGIYRSLNNAADLRDERVRYDRFCLAKGSDDCPSDQTTPEFSFTATPHQGATTPGGSTTYDIATMGLRGFDGQTALYVSGLPAGGTAVFTPASITGGSGFSSLTVTTPTDAAAGNYPLVVEGISGMLSHVDTVPLVVSDFALTASPAIQTIKAGQPTEFGITVNPLNGFDEDVHLSVSGLPDGVVGVVAHRNVHSGNGTAGVILFAQRGTQPGTYPIQIAGTSGSLTRTVTATLVVSAQ
jgi:hypothetical protein